MGQCLANTIPHATAHMPLPVNMPRRGPKKRGRHSKQHQDAKMTAMTRGE